MEGIETEWEKWGIVQFHLKTLNVLVSNIYQFHPGSMVNSNKFVLASNHTEQSRERKNDLVDSRELSHIQLILCWCSYVVAHT